MLLSRSAAVATKLAEANGHPRDARVTFDEPTHTYAVDGKPMPISVTGLLASVDPEPFDPIEASQKVFNRRLPHESYSRVLPDGTVERMTPEEIRAKWVEANVLGTHLHAKIERFLNDVAEPEEPPPEMRHFHTWLSNITANGYEPYRTEWVIYDEDAGVAGSVDAVFRHKVTGDIGIIDWKRCLTHTSSGFSEAFRNKRLLPPADHLEASKLNKWRLQINVYREILERHYGVKVGFMAMVVLHPQNPSFEEYVHDVDDTAARLLAHQATRK